MDTDADDGRALIPPIGQILDRLKNGNGAQGEPHPVSDHIGRATSGLEQWAGKWAEAIEHHAKRQLDADTRRYEDSMALAANIRRKGAEVANEVQDWAMLTREVGLDMKGAFERLNGNQPSTDPTNSPA